MRSLPSPRRRRHRSEVHRAIGRAILLLAALTVAGCAGARVEPAPAPAIPAEDLPFLLPPSTGFPHSLDPEWQQELASGHRLLLSGRLEAAERLAEEMLAIEPQLAPAQVLAAQATLAQGDPGEARRQVEPVLGRYPDYTAAQLVAARAADRLGELPAAFEGYLAASEASAAAAERAAVLRDRAVQVVAHRARDALRRGHFEEAARDARKLEAWDPLSRHTLETTAEVARAAGDSRRELQAVRGLLTLEVDDRALLERRAELELAVGEAAVAVDILQRLRDRYPREPELAERLERAKFRWRLQTLPAEVQRRAARQQLTRADHATLLYWLAPGVRAGVAQSARIATDILDHPQRQEIMRVVNLHLMDVDPTLRRFEPEATVTRLAALRSLLRVLLRAAPSPLCLAPLQGSPAPSREAVCEAAVACGFVPSTGDCLAAAGVSGDEALEWIRRTLALQGAP
ncbi:MAG TPA: hypothetical protein VMT16_08295 [Thermoanaerobaculia bacterium]|nr:hypothetical protein [Thermoanaerobaculia bacterium]